MEKPRPASRGFFVFGAIFCGTNSPLARFIAGNDTPTTIYPLRRP